MGPKGPRCLFSLMHSSILVTSSKRRNAAAAAAAATSPSLCLSLWSVSLSGCGNRSPRDYPFPMSPWGRRPEDTLWGGIEGCCGKLQSCASRYGDNEVNWPVWEFSKENVR